MNLKNVLKHLALRGYRVDDKVSRLQGVVTDVSFDLYGCIQALITPPAGPDKKPRLAYWYDVKRLALSPDRIVTPVAFSNGGIEDALLYLGQTHIDLVSGITGIGASVSFGLGGTVEINLNPGIDEAGVQQESYWVPLNRIRTLDATPVMERPNFEYGTQAKGDVGPAEKSFRRL